MDAVHAELERGSEWDARILAIGFLLVVLSFVSTFDSELWEQTDRFLVPLLLAGVSLVLLDVILRLFRSKLQICILRREGNSLQIGRIKNLPFSGWISLGTTVVETKDIVTVRAHNFYTMAAGSTQFWVAIELANRKVVEFNLGDRELLRDMLSFFESSLPEVPVDIDEQVSLMRSR